MRLLALALALAILPAPSTAQVEILEAPEARQRIQSPARLKAPIGPPSRRAGAGESTTMLGWATKEFANVTVGTVTLDYLVVEVTTGRKGGRVSVNTTTAMEPGTDQDVRIKVSLYDGEERVFTVPSIWWNHDEGKTEQRTFAGRQDWLRDFWLELAQRGGASLHVEIEVKPQR